MNRNAKKLFQAVKELSAEERDEVMLILAGDRLNLFKKELLAEIGRKIVVQNRRINTTERNLKKIKRIRRRNK